jgi:hypothetical protein
MSERIVVLEMARLEAAHLTDLVEQFAELLADGSVDDPAVARLVPDAYRDDPEAAADFRSVTQGDLLERRVADTRTVRDSLRVDGERLVVAEMDESAATEILTLPLDEGQGAAWLRTLAALRLVLAARLGITDEDDHDDGDPRFGVYDWLGYRLDGLLHALDD